MRADGVVPRGTGRTRPRPRAASEPRRHVRALVRSAARLPAGVAHDPRLTVVEADLLSLSDEQVREQVDGCDLGDLLPRPHDQPAGVFGPPRDLVTRSVERVYRASREAAARAAREAHPHEQRLGEPAWRPGRASRALREGRPLDAARPRPSWEGQPARRGLPPGRRRGCRSVRAVGGRASRHLKEGEVTEYALHEGVVDSLFRPGETWAGCSSRRGGTGCPRHLRAARTP